MDPAARAVGAPHSVKRWQLSGTDYDPEQARSMRPETFFSTWTPLTNKPANAQLFEERVNLLLHWFNLWTDRQRKHLLSRLLAQCRSSQLKFCRDILVATLPVTHVDFTMVLPRFLSLYVMSFLSPRDLCSAAQVSWHWRVLAEQDCLWAGRCIKRGWFLPYCPAKKEYGAWKSHYVSCVATLDWLTPREAAEQYGALNQPSLSAKQEEEERRAERRIRQMIRDRLEDAKKSSLRTRKAWSGGGSPRGASGGRAPRERPGGGGVEFSSWPWLSWPPRTVGKPGLSLSLSPSPSPSTARSLEAPSVSSQISHRPSEASDVFSTSTYRPPLRRAPSPIHHADPIVLLLISNKIPAYEVVLSGVTAGVMAILYEHKGSLSAVLAQAHRALSGRLAGRLGLLAPGGAEEVRLLHNVSLSEKTLLAPDLRDFWEKLSGWAALTEDGGGVDIFSPLAASVPGLAAIQTLSTLTGLEVRAPMGLATGSFQNILGEWSDGSNRGDFSNPRLCEQAAFPALRYMCEAVLQAWCRQAWWMEETLGELKGNLGPRLQQVGQEATGRALGHFLSETICLEQLPVCKDLSEALTEGLAALTKQEKMRPLDFLADFLTNWRERQEGEEEGRGRPRANGVSLTPRCYSLLSEQQTPLDWRGSVARELHHSERLYSGRLHALLKAYQRPLTAALNSNRAIVNHADVQMVFNPIEKVLEISRIFLQELQARLEQWGAEQCVGDVCVKLCSKLRVYTNYLSNYPTAVRCVDKCRETRPRFRAFLKQTDRTLATHMLSLQELLLCPVWRVEEYITLLHGLSAHTRSDHPDHTHVSGALTTLLQYREFVRKLKRSLERDDVMEEMQQLIQGCPKLREGNRQLLIRQDAALLSSPDDNIPVSLRTFEHVSDAGLFLFNDALVITKRSVRHAPFRLTQHCTYTFQASVALSSLSVREITHTRYVRHAFILDGPFRHWVCATERGEDSEQFLCVLHSAIDAATTA